MSLAVCVCGWYLHEYDALYRALYKLHHFRDTPVHVVSHKDDPFLKIMGIPYDIRDNRGLEFGAYDHYIKHIWDRTSGVLFMHDDVVIRPFMKDYEILPPEKAWDPFRDAPHDHAYVFRDRNEDVVNDGKHGRMLYLSPRAIEFYLEKGGIPNDGNNQGHTADDRNRPEGVKPFNYAVNHFDMLLDEAKGRGMTVRAPVYLGRFAASYRGQRGEMKMQDGRITVSA